MEPMDISDLIPDIPASPKFTTDSEEEKITCGQRTPPPRKDKILLKEEVYQKVRQHADTLGQLQAATIALTEEIKSLDVHLEKRTIPQHLRVYRNPPRLPKSLNCSQDFSDSWDSAVLRAGRGLCRVWREELSRQAKRQKQRFLEKEERARTDLESTEEGEPAKKLLEKLLHSSARKE